MNTDSSKQQGLGLSVRGLRKSYNGIGALKDMDFEVFARVIKVWRGEDF